MVGARYIERGNETALCGARVRASVYLPHTPYRLSSLPDLPLAESLYLLGAAFAGFQKLCGLIGAFWPSEEMVGIDGDGRVRVWLNSDYSRHYLYGPHYIDPRPDQHTEEDMIRQLVALVERKTIYPHPQQHEKIPRLADWVEEARGKLSFAGGQKLISAYARRVGLAVPRYLVSVLGMESRASEGSQYETSGPASEDPFKVSQSNILRER